MVDYRSESYKKYAAQRFAKSSSKDKEVRFKEGVVQEGYGQQAISGRGAEGRIEFVGTTTDGRVVTPVAETTVQPDVSPVAQEVFRDKSITSVPVSPGVASKLSQQSLRTDTPYYVDVKKRVDDKQSVLENAGQQYEENVENKLVRFTRSSIGRTKEAATKGEVIKGSIEAGKSALGLLGLTGTIAFKEIIEPEFELRNRRVYVSPEFLVSLGLGASNIKMKPISFVESKLDVGTSKTVSESPTFRFVKKRVVNAQTNDLILREAELAVKTESRVGRVKSFKTDKNAVSIELQLSPIEEIRVFGKSKKLGGIETGTEYLIVKKGKSELVNPADIPKYQAVELTGTSRETNTPLFNKVVEPSDKLLEINPQLQRLPGGNLGSVTSDVRGASDVSRNVRDVVSSKRFDELLNLKGASISADDFVANIDVMDLSGAKVFRKRFVQPIEGVQSTSASRDVRLKVSGVNFDRVGGVKPGSSFDRLSYGKGVRYNPNQIEDLRFNIGYVDKKQLVARNIRDVTEFESGFRVKLYTYDDMVRVFRDVEVFIPKKASFAVNVAAGVTTFSDIQKKRGRVESSDVGNVVGDQVTVLKTDVNVQSGKASVNDLVKAEVKTDSKSKSESKKKVKESEFDFKTSVGDNKYYSTVGGGFDVNRVYSSESASASFGVGSRRGGFIGYFTGSRSNVDSLVRSNVRSGVDRAFNVRAGVDTSTGLKINTTPDVARDVLRSTAQRSSSSLVNIQRFKSFDNFGRDFRSEDGTGKKKRRRFDLDFNFDKDKSLFGVEVRRFGTFKVVGEGLSLKEAVKVGRFKVGTSAAATFRITKGGRPVEVDFRNRQFYSKGVEVIEKPSFRIKSGGELREITFKGIEAQRRNRFEGLI